MTLAQIICLIFAMLLTFDSGAQYQAKDLKKFGVTVVFIVVLLVGAFW